SFVIAAFTWLIVTNMEDPVTEVTFYNIPVTIANASYLESNSQIPALTDGRDTVNVTIKAKSSVIKDLDQEDITAQADMTQIISMDTTPVMVPVTAQCTDISAEDITVNPGNIPIDVEEKVTIEQKIYSTYGDTLPDKNYEVGSVKAEPD